MLKVNLKMGKLSRWTPFLGSSGIFLILQMLTFLVLSRVAIYIETNQIVVPRISTEFALFYFLGSVAVIGVILYFIPITLLRLVLKAFFAFMFAWGIFVFTVLFLPVSAAVIAATGMGLYWFIQPRLWLHNILLIFSLVSLGATLGPVFSPWAVGLLLGVLSVYDLIAVGTGYMIWMVRQMALSETIPAFLLPRKLTSWNMTFKQAGVKGLLDEVDGRRELTVLGGGDLGLPLVLLTSVYFTRGFLSSLIVAVFTFLGLFVAYFIQIYVIKGKPLPALPPIAAFAFTGFLVGYALNLG
jgi:presenilin-like A22 family membrane protease